MPYALSSTTKIKSMSIIALQHFPLIPVAVFLVQLPTISKQEYNDYSKLYTAIHHFSSLFPPLLLFSTLPKMSLLEKNTVYTVSGTS